MKFYQTSFRRVELAVCPIIVFFKTAKQDKQNTNRHTKTNPLVFKKGIGKMQIAIYPIFQCCQMGATHQ